VDEALAKVGMTARAKHFPAQLSAGNSSGWPSRARSADGHRSCWPTNDRQSGFRRRGCREALLRELHAEGATICLVTHDERYARDAQRTIRLFDGKIVGQEVEAELSPER